MGHIFVSYAAADKGIVQGLIAKLASYGFEVWTDTHGIAPGRAWRRQIVDAITSADVVLLVLSERSATSLNVRKEIDIAEEALRQILPAEIEPVSIPKDLAYQLAGLQRINVQNHQGQERLVRALKDLVDPLNPAQANSMPGVLSNGTPYDGARTSPQNAIQASRGLGSEGFSAWLTKRVPFITIAVISAGILSVAVILTFNMVHRRNWNQPAVSASGDGRSTTAPVVDTMVYPSVDSATETRRRPITKAVPPQLTPLDRLVGSWQATDEMFDMKMTATLVIADSSVLGERRGKLVAVFGPKSATPATDQDKAAFERVESEVTATLLNDLIILRTTGSRTFQHDGTTSSEESMDQSYRVKWNGADAFELRNPTRDYIEFVFKRQPR